jgi:hypothetical protein
MPATRTAPSAKRTSSDATLGRRVGGHDGFGNGLKISSVEVLH